MTEEEAFSWLRQRGWGGGEAGERLATFARLVLEEADRQNLISARSREQIWARHVVDSAQLLALCPQTLSDAPWVDLGAGAGFPGIVVACLTRRPMCLIEVRPLRAAFLRRCAERLGLDHVEVLCTKVEKARLQRPAAVISARAYAPMNRLLQSAHHLSDENTIWLLPKGRNGEKELEIARRDWQAVFHVEQSITDPESIIVIIQQLGQREPATHHASQARRSTSSHRRQGR